MSQTKCGDLPLKEAIVIIDSHQGEVRIYTSDGQRPVRDSLDQASVDIAKLVALGYQVKYYVSPGILIDLVLSAPDEDEEIWLPGDQ
jgi:hypothetical protein